MLQEGTHVGTVLEKQFLVGLENIFIRLREVELIVDVARDDNSWEQKLYLIQGCHIPCRFNLQKIIQQEFLAKCLDILSKCKSKWQEWCSLFKIATFHNILFLLYIGKIKYYFNIRPMKLKRV